MSDAVVCDNCDAQLIVNKNGDDENGERVAWIVVIAASLQYDACSRSCATELLADGAPLADAVDAQLEVITDIVRTIRGGSDGPTETEASNG